MRIEDINYSELPPHCQEGMRAYFEQRRPVGDFLYAVLCNDLRGAFERADDINTYRMRDYVTFLYNQVPTRCYGSPEKVKKWLAGGSDEE